MFTRFKVWSIWPSDLFQIVWIATLGVDDCHKWLLPRIHTYCPSKACFVQDMSIGCSNMFKQLRLHGLTSWVGVKSLLPGEGRRWDCYWWLLRGMPRFFYIFPGCSCECESPHPMVHWHDPSPDGVSQTVGQWDDGPDNPHFLKEPSFPTVEGLTQFEWDYKSLLFIIENYWWLFICVYDIHYIHC